MATVTVALPGADDVFVGTSVSPTRRRTNRAQIVRFLVVGAICTATFSVIFLALNRPLGNTVANTIALVVAAVLNTALNRRHTFGIDGNRHLLRHHGQGLVILAANWLLSTGALACLDALAPMASGGTRLAVISCANLAATALRYVLLRWWVFRP